MHARTWMLLAVIAVLACGDDATAPDDAAPTDASTAGSAAGGGAGTSGGAGPGAGRNGGSDAGGNAGAGRGGSSGTNAGGSGGASGSSGNGGAGNGGAGDSGDAGVGISAAHPGDVDIAEDERVLFHSDFEQGLAGWSRYTQNTDRLDVITDDALSHAGDNHLRAQVTRSELAADQYISANAQIDFARRVPQVFIRFYARFVAESAVPHHWVRVAAGTESFQSDGLANTVPNGDQGFWFDLDARRDQFFSFYVYWYRMRSGRCNDGSATPGCAGDQGMTYYYGNDFTPAGQTAFERDAWICLEIMAKANTVGEQDGALALYKDDALVGEYAPGTPRGRWLRASFFTWGQYYEDEQAFEGFDFRSSEDVLLKRFTLDAYYEEGTLNDLAMETTVPEAQVILYDDVVIATERVGCMVQ